MIPAGRCRLYLLSRVYRAHVLVQHTWAKRKTSRTSAILTHMTRQARAGRPSILTRAPAHDRLWCQPSLRTQRSRRCRRGGVRHVEGNNPGSLRVLRQSYRTFTPGAPCGCWLLDLLEWGNVDGTMEPAVHLSICNDRSDDRSLRLMQA